MNKGIAVKPKKEKKFFINQGNRSKSHANKKQDFISLSIKKGSFKNNGKNLIIKAEEKIKQYKKKLTNTKLRQYYDEFQKIYNYGKWEKEKTKLKTYMLVSKIKYDKERNNNNKGLSNFYKDFRRHINLIWGKNNWKRGFKLYKIWLESLIAVGKSYLKDN